MSRVEDRFESSKEKLSAVENYLAGALKSVSPPSDVIQRLQNRIGSLEPHYFAKRMTNWELVLIITGSVMSVAMVILTVARALFYFFGRRGGRMV